MDYTEQFIRLNCSLMSDYKMMKLKSEPSSILIDGVSLKKIEE